MALLPENTRLVIEPKKLKEYLLNEDHEMGKAKAAYFVGNGFKKKNPTPFRNALENHARTRPMVADTTSEYGRKVTIECAMAFPDGKERCVRTVWISADGEILRFIPSYPAKRKLS